MKNTKLTYRPVIFVWVTRYECDWFIIVGVCVPRILLGTDSLTRCVH